MVLGSLPHATLGTILTHVLAVCLCLVAAVFDGDSETLGRILQFCDEQESVRTETSAVGGGVAAVELGPCAAILVRRHTYVRG